MKQACLEANRRFPLDGIVYDLWQCELMAEQLRSDGLKMVPYPFTAKNCDVMATTLLRVFRNREIDLYRDPALIRDLARLTIVERQTGFKLQVTRDEHGHCDRATAMSIALPTTAEWMRELLDRATGSDDIVFETVHV